jgi:hypothetical protein
MFCQKKSMFHLDLTNRIDADNWKLAVSTGFSLVNLEDFILVCGLFEQLGDIRGLIEISLWMIAHSSDRRIFCYIIDTFQRHEVSFVVMGRTNKIFLTLFAKVFYWWKFNWISMQSSRRRIQCISGSSSIFSGSQSLCI